MSAVKKLSQILNVENILTPSKDSIPSLKTLIDKRLSELTVSKTKQDTDGIYWGAERYGLEKTKAFTALSESEQKDYLKRMSELNLSLSAFIETSGHNYGAKMILLAETLEEKSAYALFASDEAVHLREFQNFINFDYTLETHYHPMLKPLAEVIAEGSRHSLVFVIQVLLEGFGMSHYGGLKETCLNPLLKKAYEQILIDESRHHGTGVILARSKEVTKEDQEQIFEYTRDFLYAMTSAHWLFETFDFIKKPLSKEQRQLLREELQFDKVLSLRMERLKDMLQKVDSFGLIDRLVKEKLL